MPILLGLANGDFGMTRSESMENSDGLVSSDALEETANEDLSASGLKTLMSGGARKNGVAAARDDLLRDCRQYLQKIANADLDQRLRHKVDPSDLVQSTLLKGAEHFQSFQGSTREELLGWLAEVMRNEIRMTRRRFLETQQRDEAREVHAEHPSWLPAGTQNSTPSQQMMRAEEYDQLMRALDQLPIDYQTVLRLRNWQRLPFVDIGKQMKRSEDAATKLWGRAVLALQKQLDHADSAAMRPKAAREVAD